MKSGQSPLTSSIPATLRLAERAARHGLSRRHSPRNVPIGRRSTSLRSNSSSLTPILLVKRAILVTDGGLMPPSPVFRSGQHGNG